MTCTTCGVTATVSSDEAMEAFNTGVTICRKCKNSSTSGVNSTQTKETKKSSSTNIDKVDKAKKKVKASDEEVKAPINHNGDAQRSTTVQEKVYGQCPKCKQIRFWENQCYDVNCHAGTLIKKLNQRLIEKEESKTHTDKWQAPSTPWSKSNSKKGVTFDDNSGSRQSMPATHTPPTPTVSE